MTDPAPLDRVAAIRGRLNSAFAPELLEITDESYLHEGHVGAQDGRGHFHVRIASARLRGLTRLAQHRLVYDALGDLLSSEIHALRISVEN